MGKIYDIPFVEKLTFINTGYRLIEYNSLSQEQRNAIDIIVSNGIVYAKGEYAASNSHANYIGFYVSGNAYYVGTSFVDSDIYYALHEGNYANVNKESKEHGIIISDYQHPISGLPSYVEPYNSRTELEEALNGKIRFPITYRLTNCTAPNAPPEASAGDTVTVPLQFTSGYGVVNPATDAYVTNNGVLVPSTYANGVLSFTMPDPST